MQHPSNKPTCLGRVAEDIGYLLMVQKLRREWQTWAEETKANRMRRYLALKDAFEKALRGFNTVEAERLLAYAELTEKRLVDLNDFIENAAYEPDHQVHGQRLALVKGYAALYQQLLDAVAAETTVEAVPLQEKIIRLFEGGPEEEPDVGEASSDGDAEEPKPSSSDDEEVIDEPEAMAELGKLALAKLLLQGQQDLLLELDISEILTWPAAEQWDSRRIELISKESAQQACAGAFKQCLPKLPKAGEVAVDGVILSCFKPMIGIASPRLVKVDRDIGAAVVPPDEGFLPSGLIADGGVFSFQTALRIRSQLDDEQSIAGWRACLVQNCRGVRAVEYSDGAAVFQENKDWITDILRPEVPLLAGTDCLLSLDDAPKFQWADRGGCTMENVHVEEEFRVFVLALGPGGRVQCLLYFDWSMKASLGGVSYALGSITHVDSGSDGGCVRTGTRANELSYKFVRPQG